MPLLPQNLEFSPEDEAFLDKIQQEKEEAWARAHPRLAARRRRQAEQFEREAAAFDAERAAQQQKAAASRNSKKKRTRHVP
jgi:hypothetical protein